MATQYDNIRFPEFGTRERAQAEAIKILCGFLVDAQPTAPADLVDPIIEFTLSSLISDGGDVSPLDATISGLVAKRDEAEDKAKETKIQNWINIGLDVAVRFLEIRRDDLQRDLEVPGGFPPTQEEEAELKYLNEDIAIRRAVLEKNRQSAA